MQPCQQCDGDYAVGVWLAALLLFMLMIAWKHWAHMRWAGRIGIAVACIAVVGASVATSYWRGKLRSTGGTRGTCAMPALPSPAAGPSTQPVMVRATVASQPGGDSSQVATSPEVVAFYFHRTLRCHSCLQIEEWAKQAVESRFAEEIAAGLVEWRAVNIQEVGNEHFEKDYELTAQSLVLVRMKDGQPAEWKNLKAVWELLGDYGRFTEYVQTEVSSFLGGASGM
jgi:hypothetical protein